MAQWIRHLTTNQGIPGSSPGGVVLVNFCSFCYLNKKGFIRATSRFVRRLESVLIGSPLTWCFSSLTTYSINMLVFLSLRYFCPDWLGGSKFRDTVAGDTWT